MVRGITTSICTIGQIFEVHLDQLLPILLFSIIFQRSPWGVAVLGSGRRGLGQEVRPRLAAPLLFPDTTWARVWELRTLQQILQKFSFGELTCIWGDSRAFYKKQKEWNSSCKNENLRQYNKQKITFPLIVLKGPSFQPAVEEIRSLYYLQCQWGPTYKFPVWLPLQINKTSAKRIFFVSFHFSISVGRWCALQVEWSWKPWLRRCHRKLSTQESKRK